MANQLHLTWQDVHIAAVALYKKLKHTAGHPVLYGVPRGGVYVAQAVRAASSCRVALTESLDVATAIVDDLVDSGATRDRYAKSHPHLPFLPLLPDKKPDVWYVFPWESMNGEEGPEANITRIIEYIGDDPKREGLIETPKRVVKSYKELFSGYGQDPTSVLKTFSEPCDEMVFLRDIEFYSTCEHHMIPFVGKAHIAYIPDHGKVVGVSKLARLLEVYSRRLQIQERIGQQITTALMDVLQPKGAACVLEAKHFCMCARGVGKQNSVMVTSSLRGVLRDSASARGEFLRLIGK